MTPLNGAAKEVLKLLVEGTWGYITGPSKIKKLQEDVVEIKVTAQATQKDVQEMKVDTAFTAGQVEVLTGNKRPARFH